MSDTRRVPPWNCATPTRFFRTIGFSRTTSVTDLDVVDARLRELGVADLAQGTDLRADLRADHRLHLRRDGDVGGGIVDAVGWLAEHRADFRGQHPAEHRDRHAAALSRNP